MRRTIALLLALALSLTGLGATIGATTGTASAAPGDGTITGTVTNESGNPLDGVEVISWRWDTEYEFWFPSGQHADTAVGGYALTGLEPGSYRVEFRPTQHQPEFWSDAPSLETARSFTVGAGQTVSGIDAELADGAMLGGKVTDGDDPAGLPNVEVRANWWNSTTRMWDWRLTARTGADGSYTLRGLAPGAYRLAFVDGNYATAYWPDAASLETAESIVVGADDVWNKDVELSTVPFPSISNVTAPAIVGTPQVGRQLTATAGTWSTTGLSYDYQWFLGFVPVFGATSVTFTPPKGTGKTVRVRVTAFKAGHRTANADSVESAPLLAPAIANAALPAISGTPRVGTAVTATPGTWSPGDAVTGYQWLLDGQPVAGATSSSYAARPSDVGRALSVRVSASRSGWIAAAATSAPATVAAGTLTATAKPKVTGKPKKNAVLKVSTGRWSPAATVKIQWFAGAKAIKKATKAKLKLAGKALKAVRKKAISVRVTASAPGYTTVVTTLKVRGKVR